MRAILERNPAIRAIRIEWRRRSSWLQQTLIAAFVLAAGGRPAETANGVRRF
jgi:hypothetical protein